MKLKVLILIWSSNQNGSAILDWLGNFFSFEFLVFQVFSNQFSSLFIIFSWRPILPRYWINESVTIIQGQSSIDGGEQISISPIITLLCSFFPPPLFLGHFCSPDNSFHTPRKTHSEVLLFRPFHIGNACLGNCRKCKFIFWFFILKKLPHQIITFLFSGKAIFTFTFYLLKSECTYMPF